MWIAIQLKRINNCESRNDLFSKVIQAILLKRYLHLKGDIKNVLVEKHKILTCYECVSSFIFCYWLIKRIKCILQHN